MPGDGDFGAVRLVVPTYRPDVDAVANVAALAEQAPVLVVDDGSPATYSAQLDRMDAVAGVTVLREPVNRGIAAAMNTGIRVAWDHGAGWVVTFDQDSRPGPAYVSTVVGAAATSGAALVGAGVVGGHTLTESVADQAPVAEVRALYQSGMCLSRATWLLLGDFDESLFIDHVDTEYCLRARSATLRVACVPGLRLDHRLGAGHEQFRRVGVGPIGSSATFHSADRRYYMNRNLVVLLRRYGAAEGRWAVTSLCRLLAQDVLAATVEDDRAAKIRAALEGLRDGMKGRSGRRPGRPTGAGLTD